MFGELPIYGNKELLVDDKKRMIIPSFTNAEENDELIILNEETGYKIMSFKDFDEKIKKIDQVIASTGDVTLSEASEILKYYLCSKVITHGKVDSQKRFIVGIEPGTYKVIGARDSLLVEKTSKKRSK